MSAPDPVSIDAVAADLVRNGARLLTDGGRLRSFTAIAQVLAEAGWLRTAEDRLLRNAHERLKQHLEATVREGEERIAAALAQTAEDRAVLDAADEWERAVFDGDHFRAVAASTGLRLAAAARRRVAAGGTEAQP